MSFLAGYVLGMTLNKSPNRSYHERDFEKEQLKIKCQERENQNADLGKKVERLQEQLNEANHILKDVFISDAYYKSKQVQYLNKWGVK